MMTGAKVTVVVITPRGVRHEWASTSATDRKWTEVVGTDGRENTSGPIPLADIARKGTYAAPLPSAESST